MQTKTVLGKMENQIIVLKEFMELITCLWINIYDVFENPQKNARQVFSFNLSSIFLVYKLRNSKEMTPST